MLLVTQQLAQDQANRDLHRSAGCLVQNRD
jgi:hypothetical protein